MYRPTLRAFVPFLVWRWMDGGVITLGMLRGEIIANRNNPGELRCITAGKREGFFEGVGALVGFDSLFIR